MIGDKKNLVCELGENIFVFGWTLDICNEIK
jgi:hypothetical protein